MRSRTGLSWAGLWALPVAVTVALALVLGVLPAGQPGAANATVASTTPAGWTFGPSAIDGGGFVNVVTVSPADRSRLLAAGDVSGLHRSDDGGSSWRTANGGFTDLWLLSIASARWSPSPVEPDAAYALSGNGRSGAFSRSDDGGRSWATTLRSDRPTAANPAAPRFVLMPGTDVHPRPTGALIAVAPGGDNVYVGTMNGVFRSPDGGRSWDPTPVALDGRAVTSLVLDPTDPTTAYASVRGGDVYAIGQLPTRSDADPGVTALGLPAGNPEEVAVVAEGLVGTDVAVYVAAGTGGVRRWDAASGWSDVTGPLGDTSAGTPPVWSTVSAVRLGAATTVVAGCSRCRVNADGTYETLWSSADGGGSWSRLVTAGRVGRQVAGTDSPWWLIDPANGNQPAVALGGRAYVAAQIAVVTGLGGITDIYVAGKAGVWRGRPDGSGAFSWAPAVRGLSVTVARDIAVSSVPGAAGSVAVADVDWSVLTSDDLAGGTVPNRHFPVPGLRDHSVYDVTFGPDGRLVAGFGDRDDASRGGTIWSRTSTAAGSASWVDERYPRPPQGTRTVPLAPRVVGLALGRNAVGANVLIGMDAGGIARRKVGATWQQAPVTFRPKLTGMFRGVGSHVDSWWSPGSAFVYLYDPRTGLWRSGDFGASFTRIWTTTSDARHTGYMAGLPTGVGDTLYVSTRLGLWLFDNARTATPPKRVGLLGGPEQESQGRERITTPGPVAVGADGVVVVTENASAGTRPGLWRAEPASGSGEPTFRLASDESYSRAALHPYGLVIRQDGSVLVATDGNGVLVGCPDGAGGCGP